ncbi:MAG: CoA-binding protein, partial [Thermoplasmata archaeon]|nr:CoA-binding protein [Thermoplasmata archaeon]
MEELSNFFKPSSVAVIGASGTKGKVGNIILNNILYGSKDNEQQNVIGGFKGAIYPINPKAGEISGLKSYGSITEVPSPVDMAVICIPPSGVKDAISQCGAK